MLRLNAMMHKIMADGTEKQINPFTGTEVWTVPGRKNKPITNAVPKTAKKIEHNGKEDFCNFCEANYFNTPPEKGRLVKQNGAYVEIDRLNAEHYFDTTAEFRRVPNLFEIVTAEYWEKNYGFKVNGKNQAWKERYLSTERGCQHVLDIVNLKLKICGKSSEEINQMPVEKKLELCNPFFAGAHELIIARWHFKPEAEWDYELCSPGELTQEEHFYYFKFTIRTMEDVYAANRYVRYVSIFQNWLKDAGASFDHLHKQLVALDDWGTSVARELELAHTHPNMYNEYAANFASYNNLVIAENDHAMAFVDLGHRYPTIAIYSKSQHCRPNEHTDEELRGFSDLVHACHAAMGSRVCCNEEWYYTPLDAVVPMPWHILIKWRINTPAGFEGGTKIYINPISLTDLRDQMVPRLYELRDKKIIDGFKIAEECPVKPNSLRYNQR